MHVKKQIKHLLFIGLIATKWCLLIVVSYLYIYPELKFSAVIFFLPCFLVAMLLVVPGYKQLSWRIVAVGLNLFTEEG